MNNTPEVVARRMATCARKATDPRRKAIFEAHAARWAMLARETNAEREARIEREILEEEARHRARPIRRASHGPKDKREIAAQRAKLQSKREALQAAKRATKALRARLANHPTLPPLPY